MEAKGDSDRLTPEVLKGLVNKPELLALTESLTPAETVAFWMPESEMEAMDVPCVRVIIQCFSRSLMFTLWHKLVILCFRKCCQLKDISE